MNNNQIKNIKIHLNSLKTVELEKLMARKYGNSNIESVMIGDYTALQYYHIFNKVVGQFQGEIDSDYAHALPIQYNFGNEYGSGNILSDLEHLINLISNMNFDRSVQLINKLIHYQALNGFWEKNKRKFFSSSELDLFESKKNIELSSSHLLEVSNRMAQSFEELENQKEALENLLKSKKSELREIEALLVAARSHTDEINNIHNSSSQVSEKINSNYKSSLEKVEEIKSDSDKFKKKIDDLNVTIGTIEDTYQNQLANFSDLSNSFNDKLDFVESKVDYFNDRNSYLDDLIGREVGASLFETFKQRKNEISPSIRFWKYAIPVAVVGTILWIGVLFGDENFSNLSWQAILVNSLKAFPAIGLLLFAISQYVKERNFQEEYAFKSAVALTVNSYAEQIINTDNRDALIMQSVARIYKSPIYSKHESKEYSSILGMSKEAIDSAKSILSKTDRKE
ncbi:hypothetical protein [Marinobacterium iners]|uniref:Uncharacterized protein n=1 Tax=Marinobacterium iners DSM 11526 TaxID=1122198 RepID=A0A1H4H7V0_9GAMM|nr:hypothetical protein [Marinobacterium iners]SEB17815.1 hypothetical protein SAMN02745729_13113 [Marinobacterium iners DSM 11526]